MLSIACALSIAAIAFPAPAARVQNQTHLTAIDILSMSGKTLAITLHAPAPYKRTDRAAIVSGALVGGVSPILGVLLAAGQSRADGREFSAGTEIPDPSSVARDLLATALRDAYGLQLREADTAPTEATRPKPLAALHPEADFILDVRLKGWGHMAGSKGRGVAGLWLELQLIDVATRHTDAWMECGMPKQGESSDTAPSFAALEADGGRTLRHAYSVLAAQCARKFASERLLMSPEEVAAAMALADLDPYVVPGAN